MLNSLVFDLTKTFNGTNVTTEVLKVLPELKTYYGDSVDIKLDVRFRNQTPGNFD